MKIESVDQLNMYLKHIQDFAEKVSADEAMSGKELDAIKQILLALIEFVLTHSNNDNKTYEVLIANGSIDPKILALLLQLLGKILQKTKKDKKEQDVEKEWEELSDNEKQIRLRFIIYEIYKLLNPRQIAGETALENFVNNLQARGVRVALQYSSNEVAQQFLDSGIKINDEDLESRANSFLKRLKRDQSKGFMRS